MKGSGRILVVSNDPAILKPLKTFLAEEGFDIHAARTANEAIEHYCRAQYAMVALDLASTADSAEKICKHIWASDRNTPVIVLSMGGDVRDCIHWLEAGCDDYITKPVSTGELTARIKMILRRYERSQRIARVSFDERRIEFNGLVIEPEKHRVIVKGNAVNLTVKEYELLCLLASNPGRVYSRRQLLDILWDYDDDVYEHTVNSHINRLRKKIENTPHSPRFILTVWGIGYRFADEKPIR